MRLRSNSGMCQRSSIRELEFSPSKRTPSNASMPQAAPEKAKSDTRSPLYDAWLASRMIPGGACLVPGARRPLSIANTRLAYKITAESAWDFFRILWGLHPVRTTLMMSLNIIRSLFPAYRGYSQALIIDELQSLFSSGSFTWDRLFRLVAKELARRVIEGLLDSFATTNENLVNQSARFFVEYQQLEQRIRLDLPTITDPAVRDLLRESDLFAQSFNGMGGFGLLSPLEFVQVFSLTTEIASHLLVIMTLTKGAAHVGALLISILSTMLPVFITWCGFSQSHSETLYSPREARAAERQERLRSLAYSDTHRPEVILFGLGPWILQSWANARNIVLGSEKPQILQDSTFFALSNINFSDFLFALQNIPLVLLLQNSSASLGSLTLYRGSIQSMVYAVRNLFTTIQMIFQGIFLMAAFSAASQIKPKLQPKEQPVHYRSVTGGVKIEARGLSYTYPGNKEPSLRDVNLTLEPGESLAIVGFNGSGKSTLAKILLRIVDFDDGDLLINGVDIRRYDPNQWHNHLTTVFQGFSRFNATFRENVGLGNVEMLRSQTAIKNAVRLADADAIVDALPHGLRTRLDSTGFDSIPYIPPTGTTRHEGSAHPFHGLSGGEWQRIAISRAFMRAEEPDVDLILLDEPTSSLDAHAQNNIFDTIDKISRSSSGERTKTVIFITHRLSTARRADKVAMMENGTISEFGTHEELLRNSGSYAALYRASV